MFSTLLSTSMNCETSKFAHPSFVEIIKQLSSDEAKMLKNIHLLPLPIIKVKLVDKDANKYYKETLKDFCLLPYESKCEFTELGPSYINNLSRLGLISVTYDSIKTGENVYEPLENHDSVKRWEPIANFSDKTFQIQKGYLDITDFGQIFYNACIK